MHIPPPPCDRDRPSPVYLSNFFRSYTHQIGPHEFLSGNKNKYVDTHQSLIPYRQYTDCGTSCQTLLKTLHPLENLRRLQ